MLPENAELAMADTDQAHLFIPYEGVHKEQLDRGSRGVRNTPHPPLPLRCWARLRAPLLDTTAAP